MKTWKAKLKLGSGLTDVCIQAPDFYSAMDLLKSMYGAENLCGGPWLVIG